MTIESIRALPALTRRIGGASAALPDAKSATRQRQFVAVSGSGAIGRHPLARSTWSGSSSSFFSILRERGRLARAFGVEVPSIQKWALRFANFDVNRRSWRTRFYTDCRYRRALTGQLRQALRAEDLESEIMQIGAMFNAADAVEGRTSCSVYMDSNVALLLRSAMAPIDLPAARVDRVMAFERHVYQSMTRLYVAGDYLRESLVNDFGVARERIVVLGMGVNLDPLPASQTNKNYDTCEILFLGSDFKRKGGVELLQAFKAVRERIPKATLHIVGPQQLQMPADLSAGVQFHGHLSKAIPAQWQQLEALFRRATLFVLPSLYEPFGIAPLEAMLYEIPCVVTNIQALKEMVRPGVTGEIAEAGCVESLAEAMMRLLKDPELLRQMGIAGRRQVLERNTWPRVVDRFLASI